MMLPSTLPPDIIRLAVYAILEIAALWMVWWAIGLWRPAYKTQLRRRMVILSFAIVALYVYVGYSTMHG